ncbi:hypothetical protein Pfo_024829 [Paulownia fortunei]|nr:hypothetical protein Pfo_024829 [Paulownia fortunei]
MSDKPKPMSQSFPDSAPSRGLAIRFLMAAMIGGSLLGLAGLTLTGTMIALVIATPVLVLFSPILVPAVAALCLVATGFMFSGGCLAAALAVIAWIYRYVTGKHPLGADQLDYLRKMIASKARDVKERAKENEHKTQELIQGS